jgi:hypothetical protein
MGFINETGSSASSTVYAVQTTEGRRILSSNDEVFNITQFCFADDEINYQFLDDDLSIDTEDSDMLHWPVLEPSTNSRNEAKSKVYVNRVTGNQFVLALPDTGRYIITQLTTGAQGIISANDNLPGFMVAIQSVINNSTTLQKEIAIDSYEIEIKKTAEYKTSDGYDFFNFFTFDMISPIESSSYLQRVNRIDTVKYVFNTRNSSGEIYQYNQLGIKVVEIKVGLDVMSQRYSDWLTEYRLMNVGKNLLYQNMFTVRSITNFVDFSTYQIDTNTKPVSFDVLIKM